MDKRRKKGIRGCPDPKRVVKVSRQYTQTDTNHLLLAITYTNNLLLL